MRRTNSPDRIIPGYLLIQVYLKITFILFQGYLQLITLTFFSRVSASDSSFYYSCLGAANCAQGAACFWCSRCDAPGRCPFVSFLIYTLSGGALFRFIR